MTVEYRVITDVNTGKYITRSLSVSEVPLDIKNINLDTQFISIANLVKMIANQYESIYSDYSSKTNSQRTLGVYTDAVKKALNKISQEEQKIINVVKDYEYSITTLLSGYRSQVAIRDAVTKTSDIYDVLIESNDPELQAIASDPVLLQEYVAEQVNSGTTPQETRASTIVSENTELKKNNSTLIIIALAIALLLIIKD